MFLSSSDRLILVTRFLCMFVIIRSVNESLARLEARLVFGPIPLSVRKDRTSYSLAAHQTVTYRVVLHCLPAEHAK
jgi:hypothetical protein